MVAIQSMSFYRAPFFLLETTYMVTNAVLGANSKTELLNFSLVIFLHLFSILGGLAPTSNKERLSNTHFKGRTNIFIVAAVVLLYVAFRVAETNGGGRFL